MLRFCVEFPNLLYGCIDDCLNFDCFFLVHFIGYIDKSIKILLEEI
jgi:hypothetical protein